MATPTNPQPQTPVPLPTGVTITLNTDGSLAIVQSASTITLASLDDVRKLWQALAAVAP